MVADINSIRCNPKGNGEGNWQLQKLVPHPRPQTELPKQVFFFSYWFHDQPNVFVHQLKRLSITLKESVRTSLICISLSKPWYFKIMGYFGRHMWQNFLPAQCRFWGNSFITSSDIFHLIFGQQIYLHKVIPMCGFINQNILIYMCVEYW